MGKMIRCSLCGKNHEEQNFKECDRCHTTGCAWCMSNGAGGVTTCHQCKKGKARPVE